MELFHREGWQTAQLCEQFGVHPNQISDWKRQLLARAAEVFDAGARAGPVNLGALHSKIGQLALENEFLRGRTDQGGIAER